MKKDPCKDSGLWHEMVMRRPVALLAVSATLFAVNAAAVDLEGLVTEVHDGDSITLTTWKQTYRVRLVDIDAPELAQAFGKDSRTSLREICLLKRATVETSGEDRFGRTLGRVRCLSTDANAEQVRRGMAWVFLHYAPKDSPLRGAQDSARAARRGLWADAEPVAPWDYRRLLRKGEL